MLVRLLINTLAVLVSAYIIPGVKVDSYFTALVVAVVLGILNAIVKPILVFLTLPITIVTLGLFILVINTLLVLLASSLVPGFRVDSFLTAFIFSLVLALVGSFLGSLK
ncbi:MAG: phage holin family protein [Candidatus Chisholmbacteria bacterium]|nr:phage holin family protein [Candidatus Chisholmbacteria bacterium]